eukprot:8490277-Pyramimonas_sp.AAC.1
MASPARRASAWACIAGKTCAHIHCSVEFRPPSPEPGGALDMGETLAPREARPLSTSQCASAL